MRRLNGTTPNISLPRSLAPALILPDASHFAFLQDAALFNAALLHFLGDR